jgi:copper chaperone CopZ
MTTVEVLFRFTAPPNESVAFALSGIRDVYGIRRVSLDPAARTVRVEFDATRLTSAAVANLIRATGLEVVEELPLAPPVSEAEAAPAA